MSLDVNSIKEEFQAFGIKIQDSNAVIDKCEWIVRLLFEENGYTNDTLVRQGRA